jgi:hypothetical protein
VTPLRRWLALGAILGLLLLGALWLLDSPPPAVALPKLKLPDAGLVALSAPRTTLVARGRPFPTALVTPTLGRACIKGRVVNGWTGAPVPAATVSLSTFAGVLTTRTVTDGTFEIIAPADGPVSLAEVVAPGFGAFRPGLERNAVEIQLVEGICATDLVLSLTPLMTVSGLVVDVAGAPIARASVVLRSTDEDPAPGVQSDDEGRFHLEVRDGASLLVTHPRFRPALVPIDARVLATRELSITLVAREADGGVERLRLRGVVLDEADAGVAGAQVRVQRVADDVRHLEATIDTAENGAFGVEVEAPGRWRIDATRGALIAEPVVSDGAPVVLRLVRSARLEGRVFTSDERPVQSFAVLINRALGALERDELAPRHVISPEGQFVLTGLPEGPAEVVVAAPGFAPSLGARVRLSASTPTRLEVELVPGATLTGRVIDGLSGRPLPGARVSLERAEDAALAADALARTDVDGRFSLSGLPAGRHSVLVIADGHDARLRSVDLPPRGTVGPIELDLAPVPDGGAAQLELVGIGAVLEAVRDGLVLDAVMPGSGAAEAGLVPGDVIVSIDGRETVALGFGGSIERIRGVEDSQVLLEVRRSTGALERVTVARRRVSR